MVSIVYLLCFLIPMLPSIGLIFVTALDYTVTQVQRYLYDY